MKPTIKPPAIDPIAARAAFADRVRKIRQERGLTIQDVAARSQLAISTISKIERGLMAPTYDRFSQLAIGLGIDINALFADTGDVFASGEFAISHDGDEGCLETENYIYQMLFPKLRGRSMTPMLGTLKPREEVNFDRFVQHPGEEFMFVLEGEVLIRAEGKEDILLRAGESIYFDCERGHLYASATDGPARILCVNTTPVQR